MSVVFFGAIPLTTILYGAPAVDTITPLLRPLTLVFPLSFLQLFLSSALQALHQETKALGAAAISTGVSLLANCTLIPFWGAYGVVGVRVLSTVLELGMLVWHVRRLWVRTTPLGAQRLASADLSLPTTGLE
jgi:O-antigen/teichoic acid export membrane protein